MSVSAVETLHALARSAALLAISACAGCASDLMVGSAIVVHNKYEFETCKNIAGTRRSLGNRENELLALTEKSDAAPGGFVVSAMVYRSELVQVRALIDAADRAFREKSCEAPPAGR